MNLATQLLNWYYANGRELPWRKSKDAYQVWVSEIMLQQTRVEAVKEYYTRWMERFPTLVALAEASEQEVLEYWQGLGYYSRARNLLSGVREICSAYGGVVPDDAATIQQLPGVGEYTAGAIASIAYDQRVPAVDGNVLRIFSRLFCLDTDITKQRAKRQITHLVFEHMPRHCPGDFNQALMDLGATVCIPRRPRCPICRVSSFCLAYEREVQETLPVRAAKKQPILINLASGLVQREDEILVCQRPETGLLAGMWEFPTVEIADYQDPVGRLQEELKNSFGQEVKIGKMQHHYMHTFSHRKWDITFYQCQWIASTDKVPNAHWLSLSSVKSVLWAGPHGKVARSFD